MCDWCKHVRHTVNFVDFQDGDQQLQFCSEKCLNQYKMNIFCKETQEHLEHIQAQVEAGLIRQESPSKQILITPELWMKGDEAQFPVKSGPGGTAGTRSKSKTGAERSSGSSATGSVDTDVSVVKRRSPEKPAVAAEAPKARHHVSKLPFPMEGHRIVIEPIDDDKQHRTLHTAKLVEPALKHERGCGAVRAKSRDSLPTSPLSLSTSPMSSSDFSSPPSSAGNFVPAPPLGAALAGPVPPNPLLPRVPLVYPFLSPTGASAVHPASVIGQLAAQQQQQQQQQQQAALSSPGCAAAQASSKGGPGTSPGQIPTPRLPGIGLSQPVPLPSSLPGELVHHGLPYPSLVPAFSAGYLPPVSQAGLPPNTLMVPYPFPIPIPLPVPIPIPVPVAKGGFDLSKFASKASPDKGAVRPARPPEGAASVTELQQSRVGASPSSERSHSSPGGVRDMDIVVEENGPPEEGGRQKRQQHWQQNW